MAWLPIAAAAVSIVGSLSKMGGQQQAATATEDQGAAVEEAYNSRAAQMRSNAGQQIAASQRGALVDRQAGMIAASKLIAAAGASGGTGAQVQRLTADILAKGDYNAHMDIYNGEEKARQMNADADAAVYQGKLERAGAGNRAAGLRTEASGSLLSAAGGAASLYTKYGAGGFGASSGATGAAIVGDDLTGVMSSFA